MTFNQSEYLENHTKRKHTKALKPKLKPFKCELCGGSFVCKANIEKHFKNLHQKQNTK